MKIHQSESKIASVGHLVQSSGTKSRSTVQILTFIIPAKFGYYWSCICRNIGQNVFSHRVSMTTLSGRKRPSSHLSDTNSGSFVKVIAVNSPIKFQNIWSCRFRKTRFLKIGQSESKIAFSSYLVQSTVTKMVMFLPSLVKFCSVVLKKIIKILENLENFRKKGQKLHDGLSDLLQNFRAGRSCYADHFYCLSDF